MSRVLLLLSSAMLLVSVGAVAGTPDLPSCNEWKPAATCNYTVGSRPSSESIIYFIVHKAEGSAASAASWFQNCAAAASAHYCFSNTSGYCYQSVREKDVSWNAGNSYYTHHSVASEHGGYTASNDVATACYDASALETKSCVIYYKVPYDRSHIIGHNQVPGCPNPGGGGTGCHTDPGGYWNWSYYMAKCNPNGGGGTAVEVINDNNSGFFSASANWATGTGAADKFGADYRYRSTAAVSDRAAWVFGPPTGTYSIYAWWSQGTNRAASIAYTLPSGANVTVNQQINGGKWNLLGSSAITQGTYAWVYLSCWTTTGYVAVADAVRIYKP